tara:strand:+ start:1000 stop:4071 length:3072 start_codon:yes stop_codon:yes gene_type:complete
VGAEALVQCGRLTTSAEKRSGSILPPARTAPSVILHHARAFSRAKSVNAMQQTLHAAMEAVHGTETAACAALARVSQQRAGVTAAGQPGSSLISANAMHDLLERGAVGEGERTQQQTSNSAKEALPPRDVSTGSSYPPSWFNAEGSGPARYVCPILSRPGGGGDGTRLVDPVRNRHGRAYERSAVKQWIQARKKGAQPTADELLEDLCADRELKEEIDAVNRVVRAFGVEGISEAQLRRVVAGEFDCAVASSLSDLQLGVKVGSGAGKSDKTKQDTLAHLLDIHVREADRTLKVAMEECAVDLRRASLAERKLTKDAPDDVSRAQALRSLQRACIADARLNERVGGNRYALRRIVEWEAQRAKLTACGIPHDIDAYLIGARVIAKEFSASHFVGHHLQTGESWGDMVPPVHQNSNNSSLTWDEAYEQTKGYLHSVQNACAVPPQRLIPAVLAKRRATLVQLHRLDAAQSAHLLEDVEEMEASQISKSRRNAVRSMCSALESEPYDASMWSLLAGLFAPSVSWFGGVGVTGGVDHQRQAQAQRVLGGESKAGIAAALRCLKRVVEIDPADVLARFKLAFLENAAGHTARAELGFVTVLQALSAAASEAELTSTTLDPNQHFIRVHAHVQLANLELAEGDFEGAQAQFKAALGLIRETFPRREGRKGKSGSESGGEMATAHPIQEQALADFAGALIAAKGVRNDEARSLLRNALRSVSALCFLPRQSTTHRRYAAVLHAAVDGEASGRSVDAERHARYAVAGAPRDALCRETLARVLRRRGDCVGAQLHADFARVLRSEASPARGVETEEEEEEGEEEGEEEQGEKARAQLHHTLARALRQRGDHAGAQRHADFAHGLHPASKTRGGETEVAAAEEEGEEQREETTETNTYARALHDLEECVTLATVPVMHAAVANVLAAAAANARLPKGEAHMAVGEILADATAVDRAERAAAATAKKRKSAKDGVTPRQPPSTTKRSVWLQRSAAKHVRCAFAASPRRYDARGTAARRMACPAQPRRQGHHKT